MANDMDKAREESKKAAQAMTQLAEALAKSEQKLKKVQTSGTKTKKE